MFKPFLVLTALVSLAIILPSSSARPPQQAKESKDAAKQAAQTMDKAKSIYKIDCALCHGDNGDGKTEIAKDMGLVIDDWTNPTSLAGKSDQDLFNTIRKGKDKMPPEGEGRAKDAEVHALIEYIRSFAKDHPAAAPAEPAATPQQPASTPQK